MWPGKHLSRSSLRNGSRIALHLRMRRRPIGYWMKIRKRQFRFCSPIDERRFNEYVCWILEKSWSIRLRLHDHPVLPGGDYIGWSSHKLVIWCKPVAVRRPCARPNDRTLADHLADYALFCTQ